MALLSKFKLNLQTLIAEVAQLRKWKQREQQFSTKIMESEAQLSSSIQLGQQLQRKVHFLEDENHLLRTNHKQLQETINNILEAKQCFLKAYQESTCEMKTSIESRDTKIAMLSHNINAHLLYLDSIRNEASSVNQIVANAHRFVDEKEQALRSELGMLEVSFKIVQDVMTHMDEEDRVAYSLILANQEKDATEKEDDRINDDIKNCEANSHDEACRENVAETAGIFLFIFCICSFHIKAGKESVMFVFLAKCRFTCCSTCDLVQMIIFIYLLFLHSFILIIIEIEARFYCRRSDQISSHLRVI
ncbi:hypothetical protein QVD17_29536 [Tagetes erecta]|uniref:Uncharacterized protein n=1 Tax=Tagetes erecta TaxID=13708 RepID=A0AAD8KC77_TARER|nr:hypothetical protein QVD17_29536 [Tagetes erecta]